MTEMLHALMDSTDHFVEDGAPQKLEVEVSMSIRGEREDVLTRAVSQICDGQR